MGSCKVKGLRSPRPPGPAFSDRTVRWGICRLVSGSPRSWSQCLVLESPPRSMHLETHHISDLYEMADETEKGAAQLSQAIAHASKDSSRDGSHEGNQLEQANHLSGPQLALVIFGLCLAVLLVALVSSIDTPNSNIILTTSARTTPSLQLRSLEYLTSSNP